MLFAPSVLGWLRSRLGAPHRKNTTATAPREPRHGAPLTGGILPPHLYRKRQQLRQKIDEKKFRSGECCLFAFADLRYQMLTSSERYVWNKWIKNKKMSAYDFFMSETLYALNQGWFPSFMPSLSGGFALDLVKPGTRYVDVPCWRGAGLASIRFVRQQHIPGYPKYRVYSCEATYKRPPQCHPQVTLKAVVHFGWDPKSNIWSSGGTLTAAKLRLYPIMWHEKFSTYAQVHIWEPLTDEPYAWYHVANLTCNAPWTATHPDRRHWVPPPPYLTPY